MIKSIVGNDAASPKPPAQSSCLGASPLSPPSSQASLEDLDSDAFAKSTSTMRRQSEFTITHHERSSDRRRQHTNCQTSNMAGDQGENKKGGSNGGGNAESSGSGENGGGSSSGGNGGGRPPKPKPSPKPNPSPNPWPRDPGKKK